MAELKNIIFDLGGVLLDVDYKKTLNAFKALGYENFDEMYNQYSSDEVFEALEKGDISIDDFYAKLESRHRGKIERASLTRAWNEMLEQFRLPSLAYIKTLADHYKIYLLSNTNSIHLDAFSKAYKNETGEESLDDLFTKAYYSHKINLRKPNKDIFEFVLEDAGIKAEETLFIDDSYNNIDTAKAMGFQTHLLVPGEKIEELGLLNSDSC